MTTAEHAVRLEFDAENEVVDVTFICNAGPDADCHMVCPGECESCSHPRTEQVPYCNPSEFINSHDQVIQAAATGQPRVVLPVDLSWNGDTYVWTVRDHQPQRYRLAWQSARRRAANILLAARVIGRQYERQQLVEQTFVIPLQREAVREEIRAGINRAVANGAHADADWSPSAEVDRITAAVTDRIRPLPTREQFAAFLEERVQTLDKGEKWTLADGLVALLEGPPQAEARETCGELPYDSDVPVHGCVREPGHKPLHRDAEGREFVSRATIEEADDIARQYGDQS